MKSDSKTIEQIKRRKRFLESQLTASLEAHDLHAANQRVTLKDHVEVLTGPHQGKTGKISNRRSKSDKGEDTYWYIDLDKPYPSNHREYPGKKRIYKKEKYLARAPPLEAPSHIQNRIKPKDHVEVLTHPHQGKTGIISSCRSKSDKGEDTFWYIELDKPYPSNHREYPGKKRIYKKEKYLARAPPLEAPSHTQNRIKPKDRVEVLTRPHQGMTGKISSRRSKSDKGEETFWYIELDKPYPSNHREYPGKREIYKKEKYLARAPPLPEPRKRMPCPKRSLKKTAKEHKKKGLSQ